MKRLISGLVCSLVFALGLAFSAQAAVDINAATQSELESVKGLGPAKAKAIVDYRQKNGPFKTLDDLENVKGFGKASIKKLSAELSVGATAKPEKK